MSCSKPQNQSGKECFGSESGSQHGPPRPFKRPRFQDNQRTGQSPEKPLVNEEIGNIFYKTRLCRKQMQDHCPNGEKCTFAHGVEELRVPPPNWQELVHAKSKRAWVNYPKMGGMMVCRYFFNGKACPYGEKCCYPHKCSNITEMARSLPIDSSAASIKTTGMMLEMRNDTGKSELQGPGSHSKAEMSQDAPSFPKKALPQVVNDASSTKAELPTQERGNSGILPSEKVSDALSTTTEVPTQNRVRRGVLPASKLRGNVSLIYGDWPADDDDMVFSRGELYEFYVNLYLSIEFSS